MKRKKAARAGDISSLSVNNDSFVDDGSPKRPRLCPTAAAPDDFYHAATPSDDSTILCAPVRLSSGDDAVLLLQLCAHNKCADHGLCRSNVSILFSASLSCEANALHFSTSPAAFAGAFELNKNCFSKTNLRVSTVRCVVEGGSLEPPFTRIADSLYAASTYCDVKVYRYM